MQTYIRIRIYLKAWIHSALVQLAILQQTHSSFKMHRIKFTSAS